MNWLEFIRVQTGGTPQEAIALKIESFVMQFKNCPGLLAADVYVHGSINGDFAIFLLWNTEPFQPLGSPIALTLKEELKTNGLVDHTVWIKKQGS